MVHITARSANDGALLNPHFLPRKQTSPADYYWGVLESDVFPKIDGALPEGGHFWRHHDLSRSHNAQRAKQFLAPENLTTAPWLPRGEFLSPPDIYVNPQLKHRINEKDLPPMVKLMGDVSRALGDMRNGPVFYMAPGSVAES